MIRVMAVLLAVSAHIGSSDPLFLYPLFLRGRRAAAFLLDTN